MSTNQPSTSESENDNSINPTFISKFNIISNNDLGSNKGMFSPLRIIRKEKEDRGIKNIFSRKRREHEELTRTDKFINKESKDIVIKAFELGFLKSRKRSQIQQKLSQIKESMDRGKAIKDVLEFTVKSAKDQIIEDLKKIEDWVKIRDVENIDINLSKLLSEIMDFKICYR